VRVDLARVASQIVVGIGFLGGGVILRHGDHVRGLTTAASLWLAAALGLACGLGFYVAAICAEGIAILCLVLLKPFERHLQSIAARLREKQPPDTDDQG
jgi:putative Mg2+ transporter-C (MgtC) family protein